MDHQTACPQCGELSPILETNCAHCNTQLPGTPNVRIAQTPEQVDALEERYQDAVQFAQQNHVDASRVAFENIVRASSHAVTSVSYGELRYLVENERRVFATFYQRVEEGLQIPTGGKWDVLRGITEHALYQHQKANIRFAALSLNNIGVKNYGECHVTFKEDMIAKRTSAFEDNNVVFLVYTVQLTMERGATCPPGICATGAVETNLAVAKLASKLPAKPPDQQESAAILIDQGAATADDRFIELHIWGPMTVRTIEKV